MDLDNYLERIEKKLYTNFDLHREFELNGTSFEMYAQYNLRSERYILTKKAKIYGIENNEHTFFKYFESLRESDFNKIVSNIIENIEQIVKPHKEHMSSNVNAIIVVDSSIEELDSDLIKLIKNFKYQKGFAFGFKGWADFGVILYSLKDELAITNKKGEDVKRIYSEV
ncbi:MAG: hypothetical protein GX947_04125 [Tissierellia bacterium]|nr:hypothetical protein [Tissierellia bacterium]